MSRARLRKCLQFRHLKPAPTNAKLLSPSSIVRLLKGFTSRRLGERFPYLRRRGHIWAKGRWISTVGNVSPRDCGEVYRVPERAYKVAGFNFYFHTYLLGSLHKGLNTLTA
ncbi:MAG: transposase [Candidatus Njordarchaeia archaeon]